MTSSYYTNNGTPTIKIDVSDTSSDTVLNKVINASQDALRVDVQGIVLPDTFEVQLSQSTDSVRIGDGIHLLEIDNSGNAKVKVQNFPSTQIVNGTIFVNNIPNDLATNTTLNNINNTLNSVLDTNVTNFPSNQLINGTISVNNFPSDLATETTLSSVDTSLKGDLSTLIKGYSSGGGGSYVNVKVSPSGTLIVDGSGVTQPVSGTITANAGSGTFAISAASLPLPTGAATETTLTDIKTGTDKIPASPSQEHTTALSPHSVRLTDGSAFYKPTTPSDTQPISGSVSVSNFPATQNVAITSSVEVEVKNDTGSPIPISASSLPLPTGAATSANQTTTNASLSSIDGKLTTTANGLKIDGSATTQPISGTIFSNQSGTWTVQPGNTQNTTPWATTLKDSVGDLANARTMVTLFAENFTAAISEALITLTPVRTFVAGTPATSITITSGKRLIILGASISTKNAGNAAQGVRIAVRVNPSGTVTATSPVIFYLGTGTTLATANITAGSSVSVSQLPFGTIELSGTAQIGISQIGTATAGNHVSLWGYEI